MCLSLSPDLLLFSSRKLYIFIIQIWSSLQLDFHVKVGLPLMFKLSSVIANVSLHKYILLVITFLSIINFIDYRIFYSSHFSCARETSYVSNFSELDSDYFTHNSGSNLSHSTNFELRAILPLPLPLKKEEEESMYALSKDWSRIPSFMQVCPMQVFPYSSICQLHAPYINQTSRK